MFEIHIGLGYAFEEETLNIIIYNVTEKKKIQNLEEINEFKNNIIRSFSHELLTPMNTLLPLAEAARSDKTIAKTTQTKYINPIYQGAHRLYFIIQDILDISLLQENILKLNYSLINIKETILQVYSFLEPELKRKNLKFILNIDERVPAQFNTDEKRLSRILYHLLENAIKFT